MALPVIMIVNVQALVSSPINVPHFVSSFINHSQSHHSLLVSENKPPSVIDVLVFYFVLGSL